jgi:hypothetical protein
MNIPASKFSLLIVCPPNVYPEEEPPGIVFMKFIWSLKRKSEAGR